MINCYLDYLFLIFFIYTDSIISADATVFFTLKLQWLMQQSKVQKTQAYFITIKFKQIFLEQICALKMCLKSYQSRVRLVLAILHTAEWHNAIACTSQFLARHMLSLQQKVLAIVAPKWCSLQISLNVLDSINVLFKLLTATNA